MAAYWTCFWFHSDSYDLTLYSTCFHLPKLQSKWIWKAVHSEHSQTATTIFWKKWFCMLSMCTSACIMQHHTTSCNMRSEVKTYEDPNSRIVLAPHEPIFLRTHDKTWQNNANLSNIFDKKTNSIRQEKFHREHVDLVRNVQRQDISTNFDNGINGVLLFTPAEATSTEPHQQTFHDLSAELMWVF